MIEWKKWLSIVAVGAASILIAGCGSPAEEPDPAEPNAVERVALETPSSEAAAPASTNTTETADDPATITIAPGPDVQETLQEALIEVEPGSVIQLEEGTYDFILGLSLDVEDVTLRGRGMDKTILDFKNQEAGGEGLYVTSDNVVLEDFAIVDTKGNGMKSQEADNIVIRRVRAEWTGGPKETNGAYGLYPVSSENVLIEECVAIGGSDSGIYVGQSRNVIVRNSRAEFNVAGIEIENCHGAEVYGCVATNNTGGILVFDLPDLPQQHGHDIRVLNNKVYDNNTPNFAPKGNIVAGVPAGMGVMVMANTNVEIFDNEIRDHGTTNVAVVSYHTSFNEIKDPNYYPFAERVHIHDNTFGACGDAPDGSGKLMAAILGTPLPDVIWDGIRNEEKETIGVSVHSNTKTDGELTFADLGGLAALTNPAEAKPVRDAAAYSEALPPVDPIVIAGTD